MNFNLLVTDRRTRRLVNQYPALDEFFAYVRSTYISQQLAPFPPALWNAFERDMDQHTNNRVESFHHALSTAVQVKHPSLWTFITDIKDRQAVTEQMTLAAERRDAPPRRRIQWRNLENRLRRLQEQYNRGDRDLDSYWRAVTHCTWEAV
ncbi:hypothetical protein V1264_020933 [Littorina saxatilis]|uniref:MULE transposase domain-containing protein n=1 Tax=Littorina saxatilis TaxID=31220 RepID=A0AAN9GC36_9CAEN